MGKKKKKIVEMKKKKTEGREVKIKEGKKENIMVYGKKANGTSTLLIIDCKALTTMSNNY